MTTLSTSKHQSLLNEFHAKVKNCEVHAHCKRPFLRIHQLRPWLNTHLGSLLEATYQQQDAPELPITKEELCSGRPALLVFSILLELGSGEYIDVFDRKGLSDHRLPITLWTLQTELKDSDIPKSKLESLCTQFDKIQWRYCPPEFGLRVRKDYFPNHVVPILKKEAINTKGGTAKVWQIEVLEEFVDPELREIVSMSKFDRAEEDPPDTLGSRYNFALKVFEEGQKSDFENEIAAFRALKGHEGMIAYLGDYRQRDPLTGKTTFNIVLEFGELDLDEYFFARSPPTLTAEVLLFWEDLFKIARAIENIHTFKRPRGEAMTEYYGWHADIKPDNVLLVRGDFKLADPGFARFAKSDAFTKLEDRAATKPGDRGSTMVYGGTKTYGAPECHPGRKKHVPVPRSIDIWSLGCVFSVAASWVVLGSQGIKQFDEVREMAVKNVADEKEEPSGDYFHDGTTVLPEVLEWHEYLRNTCRRSDPITSEVLHLVDRKMLRARAEERSTAAELCTELTRLLTQCNKSPHFVLPESLSEALHQMDQNAPSQPRHSEVSVAVPPASSKTLRPPGSGDGNDHKERKDRKSQRYAETPLLKTTNRSEVLKSSFKKSQSYHQITPIQEEPVLSPPLPTRPASTKVAAPPPVLSQSSISSRHHQQKKSLSSPPMHPALQRASTSSITLIPKNSDNDAQNVWQARMAMDREKNKSLFRRTGKDELLTKHFGKQQRDIHFLIDNPGTMASYWDEAIYLLETLVMKAKGQDKNGMDLTFANGPVSRTKEKDPSAFKEAMEDPLARPQSGSTTKTNIRSALGDILDGYIKEVEASRQLSNSRIRKAKMEVKVKDLTIIIFTDGKWEGIMDKDGNVDKEEVGNTIVKFTKTLQKVQGESLRFRQVSFEFVQFGFDADATARLQELDDDLPQRGVDDIVDTEPARGDVNKMLLGSFVEEYDAKKGDELFLFSSTPTRPSSSIEDEPRTRGSQQYTADVVPLVSSPPALENVPVPDPFMKSGVRQLSISSNPDIYVSHSGSDESNHAAPLFGPFQGTTIPSGASKR